MGALNVNGSTKVADFKQFARSCLATCPYTDAAVNTLQWRHNERDGVSNHQPHVCLLSYLYSRRAKKISKLRVTGLCEGNSPVTGEFPAQKVINAENVSIWWRHHISQHTDSGLHSWTDSWKQQLWYGTYKGYSQLVLTITKSKRREQQNGLI